MNKSANEFTLPGGNLPLSPSPLVHREHWERSDESRLGLMLVFPARLWEEHPLLPTLPFLTERWTLRENTVSPANRQNDLWWKPGLIFTDLQLFLPHSLGRTWDSWRPRASGASWTARKAGMRF